MKADFLVDTQKLKIATARACMSFRQLARAANVAPETVSRLYRTNKNTISVTCATAGKLARALGVDVLDIVEK